MKIILYVLASFLETALGIWSFVQTFPKRECMEKKHIVAEGILITELMLISYSFSAFYLFSEKMENLQEIFMAIYLLIILCFAIYRASIKGKMEKQGGAVFAICLECVVDCLSVLVCI